MWTNICQCEQLAGDYFVIQNAKTDARRFFLTNHKELIEYTDTDLVGAEKSALLAELFLLKR